MIIVQHGIVYGWNAPTTKTGDINKELGITQIKDPWNVPMLQKAKQAKDSGQTTLTVARYVFNLPKKQLTKKEINDTYRERSLKWHPDRVSKEMKPLASEVMKIINNAHKNLLKGLTVEGQIELVRNDLQNALKELAQNQEYINDKDLFNIMLKTYQTILLEAQENKNRANNLHRAADNLSKYKELFTYTGLISPTIRVLRDKFYYINEELKNIYSNIN